MMMTKVAPVVAELLAMETTGEVRQGTGLAKGAELRKMLS